MPAVVVTFTSDLHIIFQIEKHSQRQNSDAHEKIRESEQDFPAEPFDDEDGRNGSQDLWKSHQSRAQTWKRSS